MKPNIEELRKKYVDNPPEGTTSRDIRHMSEEELLDMDYFLNENDLFADAVCVEVFYIFYTVSFHLHAPLCELFLFKRTLQAVFPMIQKRPVASHRSFQKSYSVTLSFNCNILLCFHLFCILFRYL